MSNYQYISKNVELVNRHFNVIHSLIEYAPADIHCFYWMKSALYSNITLLLQNRLSYMFEVVRINTAVETDTKVYVPIQSKTDDDPINAL